MRYVSLFCAVVLITGCDNVDVSDQITGDTLCFQYFNQCVNRKFDDPINGPLSCAGSGGAACHNVAGGVGGTFKIHASAQMDTPEMQGNFFAAKAFANLNAPANSLLLLKPLANSGVNHGGGDVIPDTTHAAYLEIIHWISTPVQDPTPVDANENPACATLFVGGIVGGACMNP